MITRLLYCLFLACPFSLVAQSFEVRTIDAVGNNVVHVQWGASGDTILNRCAPAFADGLQSMAGADRLNPRSVSNLVAAQTGDRPSSLGLNDLWWAFGQFLDHDITLTHDSPSEFIGIAVPMGDAVFDPDSTGQVMLPMMRSASVGDSTSMRRYSNEITAFIDGSNIYGSDQTRADYLRAFEGGRLRVTSDDLPIFNTLTGEYAAPVDPTAPMMDGQRSPHHRLFVCGDTRANENSLLATLHTVWVREHNRLCDSLAVTYPTADDEQLYQRARALVAGMLQRITNEEWLPAMGIELEPYQGYQAETHPGIGNEFASAAFRFGHSLVGSELELRGPDNRLSSSSPLSLREIFFDPIAVVQQQGVDALLRGAAMHHQQELDCEVVDDLRNFLFGQPGAGGLDLAAININRGRDRGLGDFNSIRRDLGLQPYASFQALTQDEPTMHRLAAAFADVDDVDAWVGLLAEHKVNGVGETLRALLTDQFGRLRDGDRFYYEVDPAFGPVEREFVSRQTLAQVITRNTQAQVRVPSFAVQLSSSTASAKTAHTPAWTATRIGTEVWIDNVPVDATEVLLVDALGRQLASKVLGRGTSFGESRLQIDGPDRVQLVVVSVVTPHGVESKLLPRSN